MLIAQISDTHIAEKGRKTLGVAPMEDNLARVVDHINRLNPPPDVVLLTGDVTDGGGLDQTENAARLLSALEYPLFVVPGNHDDRTNLWSVFQGKSCPSKSSEFVSYVVEDFDVRLIGLDTTIANASGGQLCVKRLDWLQARLSEYPNKPTIFFMHHPPLKIGVLETDMDGFIGAENLGKMVERYSNIERIICGHIHLTAHARWHDTVVSSAPSTGMRLALDLTMKKPSAFYLVSPGYQLHHWTANEDLITHTITIDDADGPHLFDERGTAMHGVGVSSER